MPDHLSLRWLALFAGACPSDGAERSECDCPQCAADDGEEIAVYVWRTWVEIGRMRAS